MTGSTQGVPVVSPGPIRLPPGSALEPVEELSDLDEEGSDHYDSVSDIALSNFEDDDGEEEGGSIQQRDPVFEKIKESVTRSQRQSESALSHVSSVISEGSEGGPQVQISADYTSVPYGIQPRATYEHSSLHADIMGVAYNGRMRQFLILDSKGITTWKRDLVDPRELKFIEMNDFSPKTFQLNQVIAEGGSGKIVGKKKSQATLKHRYLVRRALQYPKYEYRLIVHVVYAPKYNCYFALGKDFSVKVLNRDFEETCSVHTDMRSVLYILFNPVRDELITGGVGGIQIWTFQQAAGKAFTELKPLANYELRLKDTLPNVGGSWVKRVDLDLYLQHLYCCSDTDLHVYDLSGKLLFKFERAHTMSITGACFSPTAKVLVTASVDSEVKVWSLTGGLVHTFRGHSRAVTGLILHPETSSILITSSLDGSIRMWSLDTMDLLYMLVVSADGVMWMGLTDDKLLFISTCRNITLWHLNKFYSFWGLARNPVNHLSLASAQDKTTRVVAIGEDSSVRMFIRCNQKNITTVLPPPEISPLQKVLSVCYSREKNAAFLLVNNREIWVYTTRTDPSCRIAIWNVHDLQLPYISGDNSSLPPGVTIQPPSQSLANHRATENGHGNEIVSNCCSLCILNSTAMMWTDEGLCCPIRHTYLLLGMEDGRILFMDPVIKGQKYMEFKASKDSIQEMRHDVQHSCLITMCKLKTLVLIQVWGLPQLDAMYEVYCPMDITCFARMGFTVFTGHESGQVNCHNLEPVEDMGLLKSKQEPPYDSVVDEKRRPEHHAGLVAMDSLPSLTIFLTCSSDGGIKVWDENKVLLTEVMLESSLSAACFLNDMGDLIVGFKNHIFYIDHSKLIPAFKPPVDEMETSDQESNVYEDPRVLYEVIRQEEDQVTLENYLVPFDHLEFDKDFLEGKTKIEQPKGAPELMEESESETETDISLAPSSIYMSPAESIESLSMIDLTLGADYTKYDLRQQMKSTLDVVFSKGKKGPKRVTIDMPGQSDLEEKDLDLEVEKFTLPMFGDSPGGSPSVTPPSGEASPRERRGEQEEDYSDDDRQDKKPSGFVPIRPDADYSQIYPDANTLQPSIPQQNSSPSTVHRLSAPTKVTEAKLDFSKYNLDRMSQKSLDLQPQVSTGSSSSIESKSKKGDPYAKHGRQTADAPMRVVKKEKATVVKRVGISLMSSAYDTDTDEELDSVKYTPPSGNNVAVSPTKLESTDATSQADSAFADGWSDLESGLATSVSLANESTMEDFLSVAQSADADSAIKEDLMSTQSGETEIEDSDEMDTIGADDQTASIQSAQTTNKMPTSTTTASVTQSKSKKKEKHKKLVPGSTKAAGKPAGKGERAPEGYDEGEEPDEKGTGSRRVKGVKVDVRGLMKKRRITSARAPSLTRRSSTDHQHDDHDHDHDHDHGHDKRQANKKKDDRKLQHRMDISKLATLPPNPPSMLSRKQSLSEQRRNLELGLGPDGQQRDPRRTELLEANLANIHFDDPNTPGVAMDDAWMEDASLHGKPLTLPPQRDKNQARLIQKQDRLEQLRSTRDGKFKVVERDPVEGQTPGVGSSPTAELEGDKAGNDVGETVGKEKGEKKEKPDGSGALGRGTPDSGIIDDTASSADRQTPHVTVSTKETSTDHLPEAGDATIFTEEEKSNIIRRPASSFTGLRRGQLEGERLRAERPHTAHVRFKAEDLQSAFEEALKRYQSLPGTPAVISPEKLYKNDGVTFEDNWQERVIERHTLLRMQKEIRAQSAAQRRQAIEMIQKDKHSSKQFPSRCDSAIGGFSETTAPGSARATTSMSVPISMGYGVNKGTSQPRETRPKTANPALEKQQMHKNELSHEKPFRYRLSQEGPPATSRPSSSKSITSVADFSPHWIDPRNPDAWRPKSSRSIPSKCNRYVLVNKPKEKLSAPVPSPLEEQLLIERFPKMGNKVVQGLPTTPMPNMKKSFSLEYSPFVYQRFV